MSVLAVRVAVVRSRSTRERAGGDEGNRTPNPRLAKSRHDVWRRLTGAVYEGVSTVDVDQARLSQTGLATDLATGARAHWQLGNLRAR